MNENSGNKISRRAFNTAAASTAFAFSIVPAKVLGGNAPSNKLNVAIIGADGQGGFSIEGTRDENIVALCDVDDVRSARALRNNPQAKIFRDFRVMFDKMEKDIDAVCVCTPDHTHYTAAMAAIQRGKHVYCEKPLAHSVYEVRKLTEAARKHKVATQMGNQGHSDEHIRLVCEWIWDGAIGEVREVHAWSDRPMGGFAFPSSIPRPKETPATPETLDWDLWLGPVKHRAYHPLYAPAYWRGFIDFGTGALGDMGCHILDPSFWALKLGSPISVEANVTYNPDLTLWRDIANRKIDSEDGIDKLINHMKNETFPATSKVTYEFPSRDGMAPVKLTWYDGGLLPPRPEELVDEYGGNGEFIIGDKGTIRHGSHGASGARIIPEEKMRDYMNNLPPKTIKRVKGHHADWIEACKGGDPASSNFDYGGPLTEMVLLGVLAMRIPNQKLLWDSEKLEFTNSSEATELVKPVYENGWIL